VAVGTFLGFRPLARRLDQSGEDEGIGSRRLIGQTAVITRAIPPDGDLGIARIHREDWRAESLDGIAIPEGARVRVTEVEGTRVMVALLDEGPVGPPDPPDNPPTPPQGADL
jgi:membrane protein implicated in regulation of membrane protease activity